MGRKLSAIRYWLAVLVSVTCFVAEPAFSFCYVPSPPMYKPTKPIVPWCVNEWNNTHTCDDWEIDSYNANIRRYRDEVDDYINDLQQYIDDAVTYAKCEINDL